MDTFWILHQLMMLQFNVVNLTAKAYFFLNIVQQEFLTIPRLEHFTKIFITNVLTKRFVFFQIMIDDIREELLMYIYFPIHGLAMSHACYNPVIYCFMNSRFREGLVNILRNIPCTRRFIKPVRCSNFGRCGKFLLFYTYQKLNTLLT